jgi:hypothetical protein
MTASERARVPGLVEFNEYVNEAGDEVSVVQVHPDAASMEPHIAIVAERARAAYAETLDATVRIQAIRSDLLRSQGGNNSRRQA